MDKPFIVLEKLISYIESQNFHGYDPYDLKAVGFVREIAKLANKHYLFAILREVIYELFYNYPRFFRRLFSVKKQINCKALGLIASSYLDLYIYFDEKKYLLLAEKYLEQLKIYAIDSQNGIGWGYPFDWVSSEFIPKNTPNGIVTTAVGTAFWQYYKITNKKEDLSYCVEIGKFLANLKKDFLSDSELCFSYTNIFQNHVHNLNLFVAEYLLKVGIETNNLEWIEMANKAVNYTLSCQETDGSFDYNGFPEEPLKIFDNYHTGFVLRMLHSIYNLTKRDDVFISLSNCFYHYKDNFFLNNGIPKFQPNQLYRIDIHSCAESINCLSEISDLFPEARETAQLVLSWTIENLYDAKKGYFYYGKLWNRFFRRPYISKMDYFRWNQAWMLKALVNYLKILSI